jgi:hypothetical protein
MERWETANAKKLRSIKSPRSKNEYDLAKKGGTIRERASLKYGPLRITSLVRERSNR